MCTFTNKERRFNYRENENGSKRIALKETLEELVCFM